MFFASYDDPISSFVELDRVDFAFCYSETLDFRNFFIEKTVKSENSILEAD